MATEYKKYTCPVYYAQVWPKQLDTAFAEEGDAKGGNWSIIGALSDEDLKDFKSYKSRHRIDGNKVKFRRYERHPTTGDFGPPKVLGVEDGASIGNESVCELTIEWYSFEYKGKKGWGSRLSAVKVIDHKPYIRPEKIADADLPPPF